MNRTIITASPTRPRARNLGSAGCRVRAIDRGVSPPDGGRGKSRARVSNHFRVAFTANGRQKGSLRVSGNGSEPEEAEVCEAFRDKGLDGLVAAGHRAAARAAGGAG